MARSRRPAAVETALRGDSDPDRVCPYPVELWLACPRVLCRPVRAGAPGPQDGIESSTAASAGRTAARSEDSELVLEPARLTAPRARRAIRPVTSDRCNPSQIPKGRTLQARSAGGDLTSLIRVTLPTTNGSGEVRVAASQAHYHQLADCKESQHSMTASAPV